ncbi:hypothetical protein [Rhodopirellula europaea]|uniref:hypothetical protein n=1 Tax=Rhodopirellula europaea TaxID=1263866 RepID=UPI003D2B4993|tara:strand:- start:589 stop:1116 length:528 start_codon:yes stop_codon:yes gene_type:complete
MRKPFFRKARSSWYYNAKQPNGRYRQVELSKDRDEAFTIWRKFYQSAEAAEREERHRDIDDIVVVRKAKTPERPKASMPAKRKPENVRGRGCSFERILLLCELLAPLRNGATAEELTDDAADCLGRSYHERTIRRDLEFLHERGILETSDHRRYRWNGLNPRSVILERMAVAVAG